MSTEFDDDVKPTGFRLKRYLAFAGMHYYPGKAFEDFVGSYHTKEEAIEAARKARETYFGWAAVIDQENPKDSEDHWIENSEY
jgi:hypothetical protein